MISRFSSAGISRVLAIAAMSSRFRAVVLALLALILPACGENDQAAELLDAALASTDASTDVTTSGPSTDDAAKSSVLAAYTAARQAEGKDDVRYHFKREDASFGGHNFTQGLDTRIDARGFEVKHTEDGWHARFETLAVRCGDARVAVGASEVRAVDGAPHRASIARVLGKTAFEEYTINGPLGVEQGFTLPGNPCRESEMVIEVGVEGLTPEAKGDAITLRDEAGVARATYASLYAQDARGTVLEASLGARDGRIEIRVNTAGAVWPVVIDPILATQEAMLTQLVAAANDNFGTSVAVSGTMALVGAPGILGGGRRGAAYLFVQSGTSWKQQQELMASDGAANDRFGESVALSGTTAVVGASSANRAYIFVQSGSVWVQQQELTASDGVAGDAFGFSVALSGTTALVGAKWNNGRQGAAYIFVWNGSSWVQQPKLVGSDGLAGDMFGSSVALSGTTALIGASAKGIDQGVAYVFVQGGTGWTQQQELIASDGVSYDAFGASVALSGTTAIVGAPMIPVTLSKQGAAYIFVWNGSSWVQQPRLVASDAVAADHFGSSVALSGTTAFVGASYGVAGAGAVYVFAQGGSGWTQQPTLSAGGPPSQDHFGSAVAVSGTTVLVGAYNKTLGANVGQGAAYVFVPSGATWAQQSRLDADDWSFGDNFGVSVAMSGQTAIVGAHCKFIGANFGQGAAYVFVQSGSGWTRQQRLMASDGAANDLFGTSVALSGTTAFVGAPGKTVSGKANQGMVYVFVQSGTHWDEQKKFTASDGAANYEFGSSVALSGTTAVVGAWHANSNQGAAYVFVQGGTGWEQQPKLVGSDGAAVSFFGSSVAMSGTTALVGAVGAAYVFAQGGTGWPQQQKLVAIDGAVNDQFGSSVALSGTLALIGARDTAVGANLFQGAAYTFVQNGTLWTQQQKLVANDGVASDKFGVSVALSGATALIGAYPKTVGANATQGAA